MEEDAATKSPPDEAASCLREDTELQQYLGVLCEEVDGYDSFASTPVVAALQAHVIDDIPAISPMRKIAPGSKEAPAPLASAQVARGPLHAIDNLYARCSAQTQKKSQHQQGMSSFHVQDSAAVQPCLRKHRPIPVPLEVCLPPESALAQLESVVDLDVSQLIAPERENAFLSHAVRHSEPSYIRMAVHQGSRRPRCGQFQEPPASETSSPVAPGCHAANAQLHTIFLYLNLELQVLRWFELGFDWELDSTNCDKGCNRGVVCVTLNIAPNLSF
eukprot:m.33985 g.33985  ORF g.33985 m.33985 type:complete len:274 (-) comp9706_c0_seq3:1739-2560(-)